jgi:hypothetical protein
MNYKQDLKKVMILYPEIEVTSSSDYLRLINIHNILETTYGSANSSIVKAAFNNEDTLPLNSANDYYYLVLTAMLKSNNGLKKVAYPMMMGALTEDPPEEFDIQKWSGLVYKIYDAVSSGDMSLPNAIDYYANTLDKKGGESDSFRKWMSYYNNGEHNKYNSLENNIEKKADYQFPLGGGGFYPSDVFGDLSEEVAPLRSNNPAPSPNTSKKPSDKDEYGSWRDKLHGAIRRIDKLLRQSDKWIDADTSRELADLLHSFDLEVRGIKHERTASDRAFNIANRLEKRGFTQGSNILMKFAQEIPLEDDNINPDDLIQGVEDREEPLEPEPDDDIIEEGLPGAEESGGGSLERALSPGKSGESYLDLEGDISLEDASLKLEEIAARLADRRVVRSLAEFDIMLDKIGIASMFPELAEAQSKLIDSYSYALTRVTKMLGMLASGKGISEIAGARQQEMINKTKKEVNKTFNPDPEENLDSPDAIEQEFGTAPKSPAPAAPEEIIEPAEPIPPVATPEV